MKYYPLMAIMILAGCGPKPAAEPLLVSVSVVAPDPPLAAEALWDHANYLAGDSLYGRAAGSRYERQAAEYIRDQFAAAGLGPVGDDYLLPFTFIADVILAPGNSLSWSGPARGALAVDEDFRPLGFSASGTAAGELVFAGYGISSSDPDYDDYAGLDVQGKVVLVLRFSPDGTNPHGAFGAHSPLRKKALTAREKGALALLVVTGPEEDEEDYLMRLRYDRGGDAGLPVINVTRAAADRLLGTAGLTVAELQQEINASRMPLSATAAGLQVTLTAALTMVEGQSQNVVAGFPGSGALKDEWIVLGAHYDHLGWGGEGSGSMQADTNAIHNGADDNASGSSTLIELARQLSGSLVREANRRSVMFQAFGAEERGLLGSAYLTKHSPVPMERVTAMLNMDMIGRLSTGKLVLGGAGTSPLWKELVPSLNSEGLSITYDDAGFGSSDHQSYYLAGKPVLFFFTGQHRQYHRPSDDVALLDLAGMSSIGQLVARITTDLVTRPEAPPFSKPESPQPSRRGGFPVVMGTIPDYTWEGIGMRLAGAGGGSPADKGRLKAGDIIIHFGATEVKSIYDYMYALQAAKAGEPLKVIVLRGEEEVELEIVPERARD